MKFERTKSFITKNETLRSLVKGLEPISSKYSAQVINLSSYTLPEKDYQQLKLSLDYNFVDFVETPAQNTSNYAQADKLEEYHEFLRAFADIFINNIHQTKDYTYYKLNKKIIMKRLQISKITQLIMKSHQHLTTLLHCMHLLKHKNSVLLM